MRRISPEALGDKSNRIPALLICGALIAAIGAADWLTQSYVSLGFLYLFPIMLAAGFLSRLELAMLGMLCAALSEAFSALDPAWRLSRFLFQALALSGCGLFVYELHRNRSLMLQTEEQQRKTRERFEALVETSPAAIVTVDQEGIVELANRAALELIAPPSGTLVGSQISLFLPDLQNISGGATQFRASFQTRVRRSGGEQFRAEVWFSTFDEHGVQKLAVIIADLTEDPPAEPPIPIGVSNGTERPGLTRRQLAILQLVCQGMQNTDIQERLQLTSSAVKNNLQRLFLKTGAKNRSQLVHAAMERYRDLL